VAELTQTNTQNPATPSHEDEPVKRRKFKTSKGEALWLLSFSDLSMILICFFILLLSQSTMNAKKAEVIREAMKAPTTPIAQAKPDSLTAMSKRIHSEIKRLKLDKSASVVFDEAGVAIEFKDGLLFAPGSATPSKEFQVTIGKVLQLIAEAPERFQIKIEGHTDDLPIQSEQFSSNWELASARGISLLRQFQARGVLESRMSVNSLAHTRPKITVDGLKGADLKNARSANRRVVVRIEPK
jgi:chemotaxis protein MotB